MTHLKNPPTEAEHRGLFHKARSWGWLGGSVGSESRNGLWGGGDRHQTKDVSEIRVKIGTKTPAHGVSCWPGHQDGRGAWPPVARAGLGRGLEARVCVGSCRRAGEGRHGGSGPSHQHGASPSSGTGWMRARFSHPGARPGQGPAHTGSQGTAPGAAGRGRERTCDGHCVQLKRRLGPAEGTGELQTERTPGGGRALASSPELMEGGTRALPATGHGGDGPNCLTRGWW